VDYKLETLKNAAKGRSFVYSHTNRPNHSQNSGVCLPDETDRYKQRLEQANTEMTNDVETIIKYDPSAIIIIAGDHGPYLTKNCIELTGKFNTGEVSRLDIQDRYGTFLAIRWPGRTNEKITILQDIFPAVFSYIYGDSTVFNSRLTPDIPEENVISGASVKNGIISGGLQNGESLFVSGNN
jgi:hypothetical protein